MSTPKISICIPAYKRTLYLERLLESISGQNYKDFEVIVTDDTPGDEVRDLCGLYKNRFVLYYIKNPLQLGTPENWNESVRHANGEWIKMMHDDDWFANENSLAAFVHAVKENDSLNFFYSAYTNVFENGGRQAVYINSFRKRMLRQNPVSLFSKNVIGPPSVTLVRNDKKIWYDNKTKWIVDIDFYIQYLRNNPSFYIDKPLINVGVHQTQVTKSAFRVPEIEIPENFYLLNKVGYQNLKNLLVYDAIWRLLRNLKITSLARISAYGYHGDVPPPVKSMIAWQSKIPGEVLHVGLFSKIIMFVHYLTH